MKCFHIFLGLFLIYCPSPQAASAKEKKDIGLQLEGNPPMKVITRAPPAPAEITDEFEIRKGFTLIRSLDEFRAAIKKSGQKIRMKPGIYRARKVDPPMLTAIPRTKPDKNGNLPKNNQQHIFAVNGSNNHFDLRDGTTRPIPKKFYRLRCGGRKGLVNSTVTNYTTAKLILDERVRNCVVKSVGPVEDRGKKNTIIRVRAKR